MKKNLYNFYISAHFRHYIRLLLILCLSIFIAGCGSNSSVGSSGGSTSADNNNTDPDSELQTSTLYWDEPLENSDLSGYKIYYGSALNQYTNVEDIGNITSYTFVSLADETICFAITAYNSLGNESSYSNGICI